MAGKLSKATVKVETSSSLISVEREPRSMNHMTHWSHLGPGAIPQIKKYLPGEGGSFWCSAVLWGGVALAANPHSGCSGSLVA